MIDELAEDEGLVVVVQQLCQHFAELFATPNAAGSLMAARAAAPMEAEDTTAGSAAVLAQDLLKALSRDGEAHSETHGNRPKTNE